jgi:hypothetical protein
MKMIPLRKDDSRYAIVDDSDYAKAMTTQWAPWKQSKGRTTYVVAYLRTEGRLRRIFLHRFILDAQPGTMIDHANGDGLDNRRENLRFCQHCDNMRNIHVIRARSGFKGVRRSRHGRSWQARIKTNRKETILGLFPSPELAAQAYDNAAIKLFGSFAATNAEILAQAT